MAGSAHARMPLPSPHQPTRGERVDADASRHQHSTTTTLAEAIETTRIHRVAGLTGDRTAVVTTRPCRAPHHPIAAVGVLYYAGVME
jgi:Magnesium chelatase, subunit ChlI